MGAGASSPSHTIKRQRNRLLLRHFNRTGGEGAVLGQQLHERFVRLQLNWTRLEKEKHADSGAKCALCRGPARSSQYHRARVRHSVSTALWKCCLPTNTAKGQGLTSRPDRLNMLLNFMSNIGTMAALLGGFAFSLLAGVDEDVHIALEACFLVSGVACFGCFTLDLCLVLDPG